MVTGKNQRLCGNCRHWDPGLIAGRFAGFCCGDPYLKWWDFSCSEHGFMLYDAEAFEERIAIGVACGDLSTAEAVDLAADCEARGYLDESIPRETRAAAFEARRRKYGDDWAEWMKARIEAQKKAAPRGEGSR